MTAFTQLIAAWRQELETASPDADMAAFVAAVIAQSGLEAHLKGAGEEEQERLENLEELISAAVDRDADTSASYDEAELPPLRRRLASSAGARRKLRNSASREVARASKPRRARPARHDGPTSEGPSWFTSCGGATARRGDRRPASRGARARGS